MQYAAIRSRAAAVLLLYLQREPDSTLTGDALCRHLGLKSRSSLSDARKELAMLGLLGQSLVDACEPDALFAPDDELEAEAERIDLMASGGKVGVVGSPADRKRKTQLLFFAKIWKKFFPAAKLFSKSQVNELVLTAERSQEEGILPTALLLKAVRTLAERNLPPDKLNHGYIMGTVSRMGNGEQPTNWQSRPAGPPAWQAKKFEPKPGEAATLEEAAAARAAAARAQVEQIRALSKGSKPRKIGMLDDEED